MYNVCRRIRTEAERTRQSDRERISSDIIVQIAEIFDFFDDLRKIGGIGACPVRMERILHMQRGGTVLVDNYRIVNACVAVVRGAVSIGASVIVGKQNELDNVVDIRKDFGTVFLYGYDSRVQNLIIRPLLLQLLERLGNPVVCFRRFRIGCLTDRLRFRVYTLCVRRTVCSVLHHTARGDADAEKQEKKRDTFFSLFFLLLVIGKSGRRKYPEAVGHGR